MAKTYGPWSDHHTSKFRLLGVLYADAEIKMDALFMLDPGGGPDSEVEAANIEIGRADVNQPVDIMVPGGAVANCRVTRRYR